MSGRAGRRGLDDKGIVILMMDEKISPSSGRELLKGLPDPINSAFHLTYNMVLNLLRVEEVNPEYMMERSFHQFQNYSKIPEVSYFYRLEGKGRRKLFLSYVQLTQSKRIILTHKLLTNDNAHFVCLSHKLSNLSEIIMF